MIMADMYEEKCQIRSVIVIDGVILKCLVLLKKWGILGYLKCGTILLVH